MHARNNASRCWGNGAGAPLWPVSATGRAGTLKLYGLRGMAQPDDQGRGWAMGGATLAVNLGSFFFLVMVARTASPAVFGALAALVGVTLVFEVPANSLQVLVERSLQARDGPLVGTGVGGLFASTLGWGVLVCVALLALSPAVRWFFHLPTFASSLLLGAYALPVAVGVVPKGVLLASRRTYLLAGALVAGIGTRLGVGIVLVHGGEGLHGALAAMVAGEVVTAGICLFGARAAIVPWRLTGYEDDEKGEKPQNDENVEARGAGAQLAGESGRLGRRQWREASQLAVTFSGYWVLGAVGVVLARHWLPPEASGWYAGALTAAQVAMIVPGAVAALVFPRMVGGSSVTRRAALLGASAVVAGVGLAAATAVGFFAGPLVTGLFDASYRPGASVVGLLTFVSALLGLVTVLVHYDLAQGWRHVPNLTWAGVVVSVAGIAIWHADMAEVAVVTVVATGGACLGMVAIALARSERPGRELVEQASLALSDAAVDLSVVVPYFNPGELLVPTVSRVIAVLEGCGASYEVIAVSDGSTDGSDAALEAALGGHPQLASVVLAANQGKGAALHVGLARGRGRYLGFIDADGDLDPALLAPFLETAKQQNPDIVFGSKRHPGSEVEYPKLRRIYSWGYQQLVRAGFRLSLRDTQTGIKLVRRDVLAAVLPRMLEKRFAFDLELFVVARRLGYEHFVEEPVRLRHQFQTTVSWRSVRAMLLDTAAIWYRLRVLHFYDGEAAPATPLSERLRLEPLVLRGSAGRTLLPPPRRVGEVHLPA